MDFHFWNLTVSLYFIEMLVPQKLLFFVYFIQLSRSGKISSCIIGIPLVFQNQLYPHKNITYTMLIINSSCGTQPILFYDIMTGDPYISWQFGTATLGFNNLLDYELSRLNYLGCLVCKCTYKANVALNYSFGMKEENILRLILIIFWICLEFMLVSCIRTVSAGACLWLEQGNGVRSC